MSKPFATSEIAAATAIGATPATAMPRQTPHIAAHPAFAPARSSARHTSNAFGSLVRRLFRGLDVREDRRELHSLSDHMLRDAGLMRDQIDEVLRGASRRP